jgi:CRISPR-associated protein Cmr1
MPRALPQIAPPVWETPSRPVLRLRIHVITPIFGGGVTPRETDPEVVLRTPAVRGHLRFWWRATCAHRFRTAVDLFAAEATLWGSASRPGQVVLQVSGVSTGQEIPYATLAGNANSREGPGLGYFLFPFQPLGAGTPAATGRRDVEFTLEVSGPMADSPEVARAIRAWLLCGGLGARTRRGCGALAPTEPPWLIPIDETLPQWLGLPGPGVTSEAAVAPLLAGGTLLLGPRTDSVDTAWRELARFWAAFRKGHVGSIPYEPRRGGRWADQDALAAAMQHPKEPLRLGKPFLGLPILYQFPRTARFAGTVEGATSGRHPSPVILRPVRLADGSARPLILVLRVPEPTAVRVKNTTYPLRVAADDPVLRELGCRHPLEAVLRAATACWREETRGFSLEART